MRGGDFPTVRPTGAAAGAPGRPWESGEPGDGGRGGTGDVRTGAVAASREESTPHHEDHIRRSPPSPRGARGGHDEI